MRQLVFASVLLSSCLTASVPLQAGEIPDYMEHWEFGVNVEEDDGPDYFADLILPLYRHPDNERAWFVEPRTRHADGETLINLGTGVRQLIRDRSWLLGANLFYDHDLEHSHYRLGWGLEALSSYAELRSNFYWGISPERQTFATATSRQLEKAVDGVDVEVGAPVPYYSRLKLFSGFNWYNFEEFENRYGWTFRAEFKPLPLVVIDGLISDDTNSNVDWGITVALRIPLGVNAPEHARPIFSLDDTMFPQSDASEHLFALVERHHEIVVEKRTQTGTMSVQVLRGT